MASLVLLSGCTLVPCPITEALEAGPVVVYLSPADDGCSYLLAYQTTGPGSLDLEGCTHVADPDTFDCGLDFHALCPGPVLDGTGHTSTVEIVGGIELDGTRVAGAAYVTIRHEDGWVVCEGEYAAEAWAL